MNRDYPQFDVLGFGVVAVDELLYVDEYPPPDTKARVRRRVRQCGGLTGTAIVAAARLGCRAAYVGLLGRDELSQFVLDRFAQEGIDTNYRADRPDARPVQSTIVVDQLHKTRTIFASFEGAAGPDPAWPEAGVIRAARLILVDHHGLEGTLRAARIARASGVAVVADIERDPGGPFAELLGLVDHLIVSERFATKWTGISDPARAAEALWHAGSAAVAVTCGAAGCWYVDPGDSRARHVPAFAVEVVDTTGCGDVFHGAYAAALAKGQALADRIRFASAVAALKATQHGGQAGIPTLTAVQEFLQHGRGNGP